MNHPDAVVVGAGPAGLACAASMQALGLGVIILEKAETVGATWRRHYDRLHLHTDRGHSALPGMPLPRSYGRYPSRAHFVAYLEAYAGRFELRPRFNTSVRSIRRDAAGWRVDAGQASISAPVVVLATGWADFPYRPQWPGMAEFQGDILHSSDYRTPGRYVGKRVLVVGFGNSGGEIALDLANDGVQVALAVRGPVQILPRDLLGIPILSWSIAQRHVPARIVDFINAPVIRLAVGSLERLGLQRAAKGPRRMIEEDGRVPLLDVGTVAKIRDGSIAVRGAIDRMTTDGVVFSNSVAESYDAIILATGFRADLRGLLPDATGVLDDQGRPSATGRATVEPGLYFCGQIASPTGQLREIALEAEHIAKLANKLTKSASVARR
jgi:cation diffusion facilitator CzcD-associated flavoprotein CzcO